jgi:hypothetical protein
LSVIHSIELTPQQNEEEVAKRWPTGYKRDRDTAQGYAQEVLDFTTEFASEELLGLLVPFNKFTDSLDPNRRQRDLRELGLESMKGFYHDNEHEYRAKKGKTDIWVGNPPPYQGCVFDNESAEWSDGEAVPHLKELMAVKHH